MNVNKVEESWCVVTAGPNWRSVQIHYAVLKSLKSLRETRSWCFPYLHEEGFILNPAWTFICLYKLISIPQPAIWGAGTGYGLVFFSPSLCIFVDSKIFLKTVWKHFYGCPRSRRGHVRCSDGYPWAKCSLIRPDSGIWFFKTPSIEFSTPNLK